MHSPDSPYFLKLAELDWHDDDTPRARDFNDVYFQKEQGLEESEYVFLKHNQLEQRWQELFKKNASKKVFTIAETGFGTGLNFLSASRLWLQSAPKDCSLHYISTEKHPLALKDLTRALHSWPQLNPCRDELIDSYPTLIPGHHRIDFEHHGIYLHLLLGDAIESMEQLLISDHPDYKDHTIAKVDAWFLDGFAPARNPSLWNDILYQLMAQLSSPGTTVATFTAVSAVRRGLIKQGFLMGNVAGFNKRNMLCGTYKPSSNENKNLDKKVEFSASNKISNQNIEKHLKSKEYKRGVKAPWYISKSLGKCEFKDKHVVIIGGGLAGATSAYAMANYGWQVTLIERGGELAEGASGNSQGMLYTKLSSDPGLLNNFTLGSYLYALRFYKNLLKKGVLKTSQIEFCGMLQLANNDKQKGIYESLKKMFSMQPELIQFLDADQASETCGVKVDYPGWYFPGSGWLSPKQLCQALAVNPNITVIKNTEVLSLNYRERWHVLAANPLKAMDSKDTDKQLSNANSNQKQLVSADVVIIANSYDANKFEQCQQLPMKTIRGQVTTIQSVRPFNAIKTVICHDGYITPEINGRQNIGATFTPGNDSIEVTKEDHQKNISSLFRTIPSLKGNNLRSDGEAYPVDSGKAGLRCMAPDYMPIVGQLHNKSAFLLDYAALTKDSHQQIDNAGQYYPGLYLNLAHGSRGLTSTPLCSELLAAQINRHPPPLDRDLINALNPARFVIRDLIKNRL